MSRVLRVRLRFTVKRTSLRAALRRLRLRLCRSRVSREWTPDKTFERIKKRMITLYTTVCGWRDLG